MSPLYVLKVVLNFEHWLKFDIICVCIWSAIFSKLEFNHHNMGWLITMSFISAEIFRFPITTFKTRCIKIFLYMKYWFYLFWHHVSNTCFNHRWYIVGMSPIILHAFLKTICGWKNLSYRRKANDDHKKPLLIYLLEKPQTHEVFFCDAYL